MVVTPQNKTPPPWVLDAVASCESRIVFVIGAGCSKEKPTCLPLASECAQEGYRKLVEDNVIEEADGINKSDLSAVADLAYEATGSNDALVQRLTPQRFLNAGPNYGHKLTIALMLEGAIQDVVTLNYDLALSNAVSQVAGSTRRISHIHGPEHHDRLSTSNIIYLHRSAFSPYSEWILTTRQLDEGWKDDWQEVIANRIAPVPVIVFAGLGAPAAVLTETIRRIQTILADSGNRLCYANPTELGESPFATDLGVTNENHVCLGWCDFVAELAERLKRERVAELVAEIGQVLDGYELPIETDEVQAALDGIDLLLLGRMCAVALLDNSSDYRPAVATDAGLLAYLLASVQIIAKSLEAPLHITRDGDARIFLPQNGANITFVLGSGRGNRRFSAITTEIVSERRPALTGVTVLLVGSCTDSGEMSAKMPKTLVGEDISGSLIGGSSPFSEVDCARIFENPGLIDELMGHVH